MQVTSGRIPVWPTRAGEMFLKSEILYSLYVYSTWNSGIQRFMQLRYVTVVILDAVGLFLLLSFRCILFGFFCMENVIAIKVLMLWMNLCCYQIFISNCFNWFICLFFVTFRLGLFTISEVNLASILIENLCKWLLIVCLKKRIVGFSKTCTKQSLALNGQLLYQLRYEYSLRKKTLFKNQLWKVFKKMKRHLYIQRKHVHCIHTPVLIQFVEINSTSLFY